MLKGTERKFFPDVVSEANLLPWREKTLSQNMSVSSIYSSSLRLHLSQKRFRVWSVASFTEKV
jgi:hypothetical protein